MGQSLGNSCIQSDAVGRRRRGRRAILEALERRQLMAEILSFGFEEASGNALDGATADGSQDGTLIGGATRVSPGLAGNNALSLNGSTAKVTIGTIASTANVGGISLTAWIDPNALNGSVDLQTAVAILRNGSTSQDRADISIDGTGAIRAGGRKLDADVFRSVITAPNVITAAEASDATWIHIAAVLNYANNSVTIYKNGVQVGSGTVAWGAGSTSQNTASIGGAIGSNRSDSPANEQFSGKIDEVHAFNTALTASDIQTIYSTGAITPPAAPGELSATPISQTQINLAWSDESNNETGFKIERKTGISGTYQEIGQVGLNTGSFPDTGRLPNTHYYYRVRAFNAGGNSGYSNEADATTLSIAPPADPTTLTADVISGTQIDLNWVDASNNEDGFAIEQKEGAAGTYQEIGRVGGGVTTFLSAGLTPGTTYFFHVKAFNVGGDSGFSNEASNTTNNAAARPNVTTITPLQGAAGVVRDTQVVAQVFLPSAGIDQSVIGSSNVKLRRLSDGVEIPSVINTSGAGDVIVLRPQSDLDANTTYRFEVTSGLKDTNGNSFVPYQSSFTTGTNVGAISSVVNFQRVALPITGGKGISYPCVTIGPDGKLYASTNIGNIYRWTINADGTLSNEQLIDTLRTYTGTTSDRFVIGLRFDPASTANNLILWATNNAPGKVNVVDFTGRITRLTGPNLENAQDYIVGLPRSIKDHMSNQIDFGPDGALYFTQGANNSEGGRDTVWGGRSDRLLTAAIIRVNTAALGQYIATYGVPLNVYTGGLADDGVTQMPAPVPGPDGKLFDPFDPASPVQLYATGIRNAFDLIWASNGHLYTSVNGSASGGNTPATPNPFTPPPGGYLPRIDSVANGGYTGPEVPATINNPVQADFLYDVVKGGYYGHPNPSRNEYVLDGGNPTAGVDPEELTAYPVGTMPDRNFRPAAYIYGNNFSPDGIIEYKSNTFGGALKGRLLNARYSGGDDIVILTPAADGHITSVIDNLSTFDGFNNPLDLVENTTNGMLYVSEYGNETDGKITLLRPQEANISISKTKFYFNDATTAGASNAQTITINNTGSLGLTIPVGGLTLTGADASQFVLVSPPTLPLTIAAGGSANIQVAFNPTTTGVKVAQLAIQSNDPDNSVFNVDLRGLGHSTFQGNGEPPLAQIMQLYQIPIDVGFTALTTPYSTARLGEEVLLPLLTKAGSGPVTIEPLATFSPSATPDYRFGWYLPGATPTLNQVFEAESLNPVAGGDAQTVNPTLSSGTNAFDPGNQTFGLYGEFPSFTPVRQGFTEDALNTWDSGDRKIRFWPLKDQSGAIVPNAFVVGFEEATNNDLQDVVMIIRNVKSASDTIAPTAGALFQFDSGHVLQWQFSEPLSNSLSVSDLVLQNQTTATTIPTANLSMSYNPASANATFTFPGYPQGLLPDGNYLAKLPANSVSDVAGNLLAPDALYSFFVLTADANRDRGVNSLDFDQLAANFNKSGMTFSQGDFNYDGKVNALDFNLLATKFGTHLAPPTGPAMNVSAQVLATPTPSLFADRRVSEDWSIL